MMTRIRSTFKNLLTLLVMTCVLAIGVSTPAYADVVSTEALAVVSDTETKREQIKTFFARDSVKSQLLGLGVSEADANQRVDALTDQEVLEMSQHMDALPAGEGLLGTIIGVLVILILLDIAGVTDIFPAL